MKAWIVALLFLSAGAWAADLTAPVNTERRQLYNKSYRDVKDGTNAETVDWVSANTWKLVNATSTVKTSGGYLHAITFWASCTLSYAVGDSSFTSNANGYGSAGYTGAVVIATITTPAVGTYYPNIRFVNGLSIAVPSVSSCPVTVSYR